MPRTKRLILRVVCITSVALCMLLTLQAVGIVPPVGLSWGDQVRGRAYSAFVGGPVVFQTLAGVKNPPPSRAGTAYSFTGDRTDVLGFHYHRYDLVTLANDRTPLPGVYGTQIEFRIATSWPLLLSMGVLAGCWLALAKERRRRASDRQHCRNCGYDLRATPDRCPECGAAAATPPPATAVIG